MSTRSRLAALALALVLPVLAATSAAADIRQEQIIPPPPKAVDFA
jgi:hypothetical protein